MEMGVRGCVLTLCAVTACAVTFGALAGPARASQLIDRDATNVRLQVNAQGQALLTYQARGRLWHVLAWGGINARHPAEGRSQIRLKLDYAGGWGTYRREVWKGFRNACRPYDGPALVWFATACKAPDGSYWALQSWQRMLPNLGYVPWLQSQRAWELRVSHWRGPTAQIEVWLDWVYSRRYHHLFGRLTYLGKPVHGFNSSPTGNPLDRYGRNLYLDTYNSAYGLGWRRENGFLAQKPTGTFCYGFFERKPYPGYPDRGLLVRGNGERYRLIVQGPGVTPDVMWQGNGLHDYDPHNPSDVEYERQMNAIQDQVTAGGKLCRKH
jgi:hypothetical protein